MQHSLLIACTALAIGLAPAVKCEERSNDTSSIEELLSAADEICGAVGEISASGVELDAKTSASLEKLWNSFFKLSSTIENEKKR